MKKDVIILAGPTGIGKTELSLLLAEELNGEIISADSMQIYKGMDIGTAKISKEETRGIKHHMLSFIDPKDEYSVKEYREDALNIIRDVISRGKFPIVVGGTGFYIESLLYKPNFSYTNKDDKIREKYEYLDKEGIALTDLRPSGVIEIGEEKLDALSEGSYIQKGSQIKVVKVEGSKIIVRRL